MPVDLEGINDGSTPFVISGDGKTILSWPGSLLKTALISEQALVDLQSGHQGVHGGGWFHDGSGPRITYDGSVVFGDGNSNFNDEFIDAGFHFDGYAIATQSPVYFMTLAVGSKDHPPDVNELKIYLIPWKRSILTLRGIEELTPLTLPSEQRVFYSPNESLLTIVGPDPDQISFRKLGVLEGLNKAGIDYLFVTSTPPSDVSAPGRFEYQLETASKRGDVRYTLASGPAGMAISEEGKLQWQVPADFADDNARVIVSVKDASGQEIFHSFVVRVQKPAGSAATAAHSTTTQSPSTVPAGRARFQSRLPRGFRSGATTVPATRPATAPATHPSE